MVKKISVISIAFVLLWMVCITTQANWKNKRCDKAVKRLEKKCKSAGLFKIPGTFRILYIWADMIKKNLNV